ncbi:MAG: Lar family restriction alleviation protein [Clostridia bacterium]|nr:Lar family restriction alleviation protein [Clostridia bacterium]
MRNNHDLKDCPFCGSRPDVEYKMSTLFFESGEIICRKCRLRMWAWDFTRSMLDERLIEKWNNCALTTRI